MTKIKTKIMTKTKDTYKDKRHIQRQRLRHLHSDLMLCSSLVMAVNEDDGGWY